MKCRYIIIGNRHRHHIRPERGKTIVMRKVHLSASARTNNNSQRQCP